MASENATNQTVDHKSEFLRGICYIGVALVIMYWNGGITPRPIPGMSPENPDPLQWFGFISLIYCWFTGFFSLLRAATGIKL